MTGRIPKQFIDDVLDRSDIVEIIEDRLPLKKAGHNYKACCPFHNEKSPSFSVNQDKQFYYCFGCGATGNAISFIMEYDRLDFVDAVEELAHRLGLEVPRDQTEQKPKQQWDHDLYDLMAQTTRFYQQQLTSHSNGENVIAYLKGRELTGEIVRDFGIGYAPPEWHSLQSLFGQNQSINAALVKCGLLIEKDDHRYDRFRDRVMFPIKDRKGRVIAFGGRVFNEGEPKYLNSPETEIFHKGHELYGFYEMRQAIRKIEWVIVVEGYMDVVSLAQFGIKNAVATLGTATSGHHIQQLFRVCPKIVFCFDGDRAGRDAALRALNQSLPHIKDNREIRFMFLPDGEDPDTQVRAIGAEIFSQQAQNAQSIFDFLLKHLKSQVDMTTFEGPGQLANLARPFIHLINDEIHIERFIMTLAENVGLTESRLSKLLGQKNEEQPAAQEKPNVPFTQSSQLTPVRRAICLLLHQPKLVESIQEFDWLADLKIAGHVILLEMIEILRKSPNISTGALIEHWRNSPNQIHLLKLANEELIVPEQGMQQELTDIMLRLKRLFGEQRQSELLDKSQRGPLSHDEKKELLTLLQEKN